jgi:hypothetical protein
VRILLATEAFHHVGGTETYVLTLADHLLRLGHQVRVFSHHPGDMAELARGRGIDVVGDLGDLGDPVDVVVPQDGATAYDLHDRWPDVPQVFVCHSAMFDLQQPPLVPGVAAAVVVLSDRVRRRVEALDGDFRIVRLRQPIDTERLVPRRTPSATPRRALLLGNYLDGDARRLIVDTWTALGVEMVQVGSATVQTLQPEDDIAAADIVVGKGRAVLDAMSCGRPAYVHDAFGADGWVTASSYPDIEADSIAGQAFPEVVDAARLGRDLAAYDPAMGQVNRTLVLKHHQARTHAQEMVQLFAGLARDPAPPVTQARELARVVRLRWRAEGELFGLRHAFQAEAERSAAGLAAAQREAAHLTDLLRAAEREREVAEAARAAEERRRLAAERGRDLARLRRRRLRRRYDALRARRWVRLGRALGLVDRPASESPDE